MSICYDFVLDLIAAIKNKPYNMNKFAKNGLLSSSLSHLFCYTQRKSTKIIPCASSGAEGETRTLAPVSRPTPLAGAPRHQLEYFRR